MEVVLFVSGLAEAAVQSNRRKLGAVMAMLEAAVLMTTEQLEALPDDGIDRELINGRLRERRRIPRNYRHSRSQTRFVRHLENWRTAQPKSNGEVLSGGTGFVLRRDPDTTVGIDVAYISPETAAANDDSVGLINGVPILVIEILSPSDSQEDVLEKVQVYLDCGVALVWVAEPIFRAVTVYRPGAEPELFNAQQSLDGGSHLPGFRVKVADCF